MKVIALSFALSCTTLGSCASADPATRVGAIDRYNHAIEKCTQLNDMDMQSCLSDLNTKAVEEEKRTLDTNTDVNCDATAKRFEGGTGYWSTVYICSIRERAKRIDATGVSKGR